MSFDFGFPQFPEQVQFNEEGYGTPSPDVLQNMNYHHYPAQDMTTNSYNGGYDNSMQQNFMQPDNGAGYYNENYQQMPDFQFPVQNFDFTNQFEFTTPINDLQQSQTSINHTNPDNNENSMPEIPIDGGFNFFPAQEVQEWKPARKASKNKIKKISTMHINSSCSNCGCRETKLWRRNEQGETECNPCNLYERVKGHKRPQHLWNKPAAKRRRRPVAPLVDSNAFNF